jgi:Spy/CpxP family protein refolding chaperone
MKSRTILLPILATLALTATAPLALAQPLGSPGDGPRGMHGRHDRGGDLVEFLGLTEEQEEQWKAAHKAHFEGLRPTFEKIRDLREQMKAELEGEAPDATTVGGLMIQIHQLDGDLEAGRDQLDATIREILTDEQQTKLDAFKAASPGRRGPGGGWGGPRRGHPGGDEVRTDR